MEFVYSPANEHSTMKLNVPEKAGHLSWNCFLKLLQDQENINFLRVRVRLLVHNTQNVFEGKKER